MEKINEELAKKAGEMSSFEDYIEGSATKKYEDLVHKVRAIAEENKQKKDVKLHEKIDIMLSTYEKKLAQVINESFRIKANVPDGFIEYAGDRERAKRRKKEDIEKNQEKLKYVITIPKRIENLGLVIVGDVREVLDQLYTKQGRLERRHKHMKNCNIYYRKHKTLIGCVDYPESEALLLEKTITDRKTFAPFSTEILQLSSANMRGVKLRIKNEQKKLDTEFTDFKFEGGEVLHNKEDNRIRIKFISEPSKVFEKLLKSRGFRLSKTTLAWQRTLTLNSSAAAKEILKHVELEN